MNKKTAVAHPNLAFVKYWGKSNYELNLPANNSISMNLSGAHTTTSVELDENLNEDEISLDGIRVDPNSRFAKRVRQHINRIRVLARTHVHTRVITSNNFPAGTGIASSASGFAALTIAAAAAFELRLPEQELSILARQGSGSACRSIPSGFVEWKASTHSNDSYGIQIAPPDHWDIVDIAVIVSKEEKDISSSSGHHLASLSPFWDARQQSIDGTLEVVRNAILYRNFDQLGRTAEAEALSFHAVALTSAHQGKTGWISGIIYWQPATIELLTEVQKWRGDGLPVYFTLDAGPTVHLICQNRDKDTVISAIKQTQLSRNWEILLSYPAPGAYLVDSV